MKRFIKQNLLFLFPVIFLSLPAILPLLHPGFFVSDDGDWMVIRFSAFHQALVKGQFPVRFLPRLNFEFGYPVADFLYPGFMYLAEPFHLLKIGFVNSIKIILGLSMIGSAVFTNLWLRKLFGVDSPGNNRISRNNKEKKKINTFEKIFSTLPAVLGAIVYLYSPYHLYDIYQRGSVGEVLALAVAPFVLWSLERKSFIFSAIGIGLLILSHNTLAALFFPMLLIYAFLRAQIKFTLFTFLIGVGLVTFFWLPALYDLQYTVFSETNVSNYTQYFASNNLIGISSFVILFSGLVSLFLSTGLASSKPYPNALLKIKKLFYFFLSIGLLSLFFSSSLSGLLWRFLPISFIQFPFRLLSITILAAAFLAAYVVSNLEKHTLKILFSGIIIVPLVFDLYPHFKSIQFTDKGEGFYATNEDTTTVKSEYMPKWVKILPTQRPAKMIEVENGSISNIKNSVNKFSFSVNATTASLIVVNMIYFPGWQATIDNHPAKIMYNNPGGLIALSVLKGQHQVRVWFGETELRMISDVISLASVVLVLFVLLPFSRKRKLGTNFAFVIPSGAQRSRGISYHPRSKVE